MKYSTLSFIISSSILLHACGSSNNNQNHTTDPNPNTQHQSNSHNINGNQSSNNSNQAANPSHNSSQQNNQNDFTPNISSGNAPNPKNNIIISSYNNDDDNNAPIPAPPKINLDTLTKDQADQLVKKAGEKLQKATIEKNKADQALKLIKAQQSAAKKLFDAAAKAVKEAKDSTSLAIAKQQLKTAQETLDTAEKNLAIEKVKAKKAEEAFAMANLEKGLADNAKKFVDDKVTEPEAVLDKIKAEQDAKQAVAEKKELEIKKSLLSKEAKAADDQAKALGEQNTKLKEITADNSGATPEAKKEAEAKIKENEDKIAKLNKQNKEKTQAAKDLDVPIKQANVVVRSTDEDLKEAQEGIKYRGVYASNGKYDASTSYKNLSKVTYNENDTTFEFHLNGSDQPLKFKVSQLSEDLKSPADQKTSYGKFAIIDGKDILIKEMWKPQDSKRSNIYGVVGGNYFSVGEVTPEANISAIGKNDIKYNSGGAFLKTPKGRMLVAKVTATANFDKKELSGDFEGFKAYTTQTSVSNDAYADEGFNESYKVHFDAKIDGNKFVPLETPKKPDDAKVYGYFYNGYGRQAGGLVEHDKFNGSFGLE